MQCAPWSVVARRTSDRMYEAVTQGIVHGEVRSLLIVVAHQPNLTRLTPPATENECVVASPDQDREAAVQVSACRRNDPRVPRPRIGPRDTGWRGELAGQFGVRQHADHVEHRWRSMPAKQIAELLNRESLVRERAMWAQAGISGFSELRDRQGCAVAPQCGRVVARPCGSMGAHAKRGVLLRERNCYH